MSSVNKPTPPHSIAEALRRRRTSRFWTIAFITALSFVACMLILYLFMGGDAWKFVWDAIVHGRVAS